MACAQLLFLLLRTTWHALADSSAQICLQLTAFLIIIARVNFCLKSQSCHELNCLYGDPAPHSLHGYVMRQLRQMAL